MPSCFNDPIIKPRPVSPPPKAADEARLRKASKTRSRNAARSFDPANRLLRAQWDSACSALRPARISSKTVIAAATRAAGVMALSPFAAVA